jgi:hypothetical protein
MVSPQRYFAEVADKRRELDNIYPAGFCLLVSVANLGKNTTAGSMTEVSTALAAKGIIDGTQRLLTANELAAQTDSEAARKKQISGEDRQALRQRINGVFGAK